MPAVNISGDVIANRADEFRRVWEQGGPVACGRHFRCSARTVRTIRQALGIPAGNRWQWADDDAEREPVIEAHNEPEPDGGAVLATLAQRPVPTHHDATIALPPEPCAICVLADLHVGGAGVDYAAIARDVRTIHETPGMYAVTLGDLSDNWLPPGLSRLQREQVCRHAEELAMVRYLLRQLGPKLLACVLGNHDLWTWAFAGCDPIRDYCCKAAVYRHHEARVELGCGDLAQTYLLRHHWPGSSIYNETHAIERALRFGGESFHVGIGAHDHRGTICRPFTWRQGRHYAVKVGSYKIEDTYRDANGFARAGINDRGACAIVLWPDGRTQHCDDLTTAAQFVTWLRQ